MINWHQVQVAEVAHWHMDGKLYFLCPIIGKFSFICRFPFDDISTALKGGYSIFISILLKHMMSTLCVKSSWELATNTTLYIQHMICHNIGLPTSQILIYKDIRGPVEKKFGMTPGQIYFFLSPTTGQQSYTTYTPLRPLYCVSHICDASPSIS